LFDSPPMIGCLSVILPVATEDIWSRFSGRQQRDYWDLRRWSRFGHTYSTTKDALQILEN